MKKSNRFGFERLPAMPGAKRVSLYRSHKRKSRVPDGLERLPAMPGAKRVSLYKTHGKEATIVVAAWNSKNPARADYVAPKEDALDFITQIIIPKLPLNGGSITLLEGSFKVSTDNKPFKISSKSNIKMQGQGKGTKLYLGTGISSNLIEVNDSTAISIEKLYLDGTSTAAQLESKLVQNGILFNTVTGSKIKDIWAFNCVMVGIILYHSDRNDLNGCSSEYNATYGISIANSNGNDVIGCNLRYNFSSIHLANSDNNTISGNVASDNGSTGIALLRSHGNTITGNTAQGNTRWGVHISSSNNNTMSGNTCNDTIEYSGIHLFYAFKNTISGNTCNGNGNYGGISIIVGSEHNNIVGNTCQKNGEAGIYMVGDCKNNGILNNIITDNGQAAAVGTVAYDGIHLASNSDRNNIQGNTIRKEGTTQTHRYGISIADSDCDDNFITNNDLKDSGVTGDLNDNGTGTITTPGNRT